MAFFISTNNPQLGNLWRVQSCLCRGLLWWSKPGELSLKKWHIWQWQNLHRSTHKRITPSKNGNTWNHAAFYTAKRVDKGDKWAEILALVESQSCNYFWVGCKRKLVLPGARRTVLPPTWVVLSKIVGKAPCIVNDQCVPYRWEGGGGG